MSKYRVRIVQGSHRYGSEFSSRMDALTCVDMINAFYRQQTGASITPLGDGLILPNVCPFTKDDGLIVIEVHETD